MKKLITLLICGALALSVSACGKKPADDSSAQLQQEEKKSGDADKTENKEDSKASDADNSIPESEQKAENSEAGESSEQISDISEMVDEFNDPDITPERKEELRKELEAILKKAESQSAQ